MLMQSFSRTSSVLANVIDDYRELIENATSSLEAQLERINKKLEAIVAVDTESLCTDVEERKSLKKGLLSSKACLKLISSLSWLIEQRKRKARHHDSRVNSSASILGMMTDKTLQEIIRYSGQGRLREAEALSRNLHLEQLNQFTNKELYSDSANDDGSSSSDWLVEESKLDTIISIEKTTGTGNASTPTDPIHEVGDCLSDISQPPSVFSLATMPSTIFTTDTRLTADEIRTAIDELVCIFLEDAEIAYLFKEAILKQHIAWDHLDRNFRRLMERFATNLKDEAQEAIDLDLASLILSRVSLVAEKIGSRFRQESSAIDTFPQGSPQMRGTVEPAFGLVPDIHDVSGDEEDDQEKLGIDNRFARLVSHGRSFIEESAAFQKLRVEFKNFVMPTAKPILLDFSFNSKEWMIRCFWSLESLLSSIGPREESDSPYPISTRPSAVSLPREIVLFSEPIDLNTDIHNPERPTSWQISRSIGCLGLSFNINHLLWAVRISWDPQKLFSSFGLQNLNPLPQYQIVLLCQPCRQSEPHFGNSTFSTWECAGVESIVDKRKVRGRVSWDPAELLRSLYLRERKVPKHHKRFRWTNRYGKRLYDDYIEREPGALQALQNYLDVTTVPKKTKTPGEHGQNSSRAASLYTPNTQSTQTTSPLTTVDIADQSVTNPRNSETSNVFHDIEHSKTKPTRPLLLLACIKRHGRPVKLHQEFVTHIADDRQLFHALRKIYYNHRQRLESFWSLRTLHSIHFMRFIYAGNSYIDVRCHGEICTPNNPCACIPPPNLVPPLGTSYHCHPIPPRQSPPVGPELMMDFFNDPNSRAPGSDLVIQQLPKKMDSELTSDGIEVMTAWGILYRVSLDWKRIWIALGLAFFLPSLFYGILWGILRKDIQGAFGVAAWWMTGATVVVGMMGTLL
ncbi:hypothetical protein BDV38DRAFT_249862 [Aspergillus pseudotamarii]|uniref:Azaphilone pigments biosynthesis cluster protein L N-terminal domain-containing protein n=1 Tax=Aspergillus pseudotamarii TaxID=132259 RepID=A0A5N6SRE6_ASPPS|nr:uncharacterized protein BDV38DRAFT_249862 [Aspergillus pseudotamarii]KAE8136331.1 hypothetical protein BDV38DRAFT_249862 [Aspergillus pseudotamarii]